MDNPWQPWLDAHDLSKPIEELLLSPGSVVVVSDPIVIPQEPQQ